MDTEIFRALADPTRHAIFEMIADGSSNSGALRAELSISQPAMSQHLSVLRDAGLVRMERRGRSVHYHVDPAGLEALAGWLAKYRAFWPERIADLNAVLKEME